MKGQNDCEVMSIADLRNVYHTFRLASDSQKYCDITQFYGSPTYIYLKLILDGVQVKGQNYCEVTSIAGLRYVYHTFRLASD